MTKRQNLIWSLFLILTISSFLFLEYQIHQKDMILKTDIFYLKNNPLSVAEAKKKYQNKDIIGYISIPFTSIHTFFTKSTNNTYYLNYLLYSLNINSAPNHHQIYNSYHQRYKSNIHYYLLIRNLTSQLNLVRSI